MSQRSETAETEKRYMVTPNGMKDTIDALNEALDIAVAERDQAFAEIDRQQAEIKRMKDALTIIADPAEIPLGTNLWDVIVRLRHTAWKAIQQD